ncbi:hypothetical protein AcW1_007243 [Taiwanofungus camphoratus]|nr:hypothetical protein AcW2_007691 [Antrodia cinnamomea]KAI0927548.1 hypothetical protein AcV5_008060 [Antrodia cinnamomea]KAI0952877.1 hypothetical protein AcW1_007243 [Antrodia cinnamomea]
MEKALSYSLQMVKSAHNRLPTINRMALEILSLIFQHTISVPFDPRTVVWETSFVQPRQLIKITHVCHHWRDLAFEQHQFWSSIRDIDLPFMTKFLDRSRDAPLKFYVSSPPKPSVPFFIFA